jgi:hypothetical protein
MATIMQKIVPPWLSAIGRMKLIPIGRSLQPRAGSKLPLAGLRISSASHGKSFRLCWTDGCKRKTRIDWHASLSHSSKGIESLCR